MPASASRKRGRNAFGDIFRSRVTYHRDVAGERRELKRQAFEERKERLRLRKLKATERAQSLREAKLGEQERKRQAGRDAASIISRKQELAAEGKIRAAERKIAKAEHQIETAAQRASRGASRASGGLSESEFDRIKAHMESEIAKQEDMKRRALASVGNPSWGFGIYKGRGFGTEQLAHFKSREAAETYARSHGLTGYRIQRAFAKGANPASRHRAPASRKPSTTGERRSTRNCAVEFSTEYHLGYNLGQADRQNASLRKTPGELHATFAANFGTVPSASWESFEQAYQAGYGGQMGAAAPNPKHETPFQYKGVTITPVPPTFTRYDVALPTGIIRLTSLQDAKDWVTRSQEPARNPGSPKLRALLRRMSTDEQAQLLQAIDRFYYAAISEGFKPSEAQSFAEKRAIPEAEKILRGRFANPEAWTTIYKTKAEAKAVWYDSAPGRNDRATFQKVRGGWVIKAGNPRSGGMNATEKRHDAEVRKLIAKRFGEGEDATKVAARVWRSYGYLTDVKDGILIVQLNAGRESFAPGQRNPDDGSEEYAQAKRIAELFHGHPVKEEITVTEQIESHDWLWRIGPLVKLKIRTLTKRNATLPFGQDETSMVHLFCSPDGRQFYLRGGDQELDIEALGMGPKTEWFRDQMLIGEAKEITYRDKKKFHKFKLTDYFHKLGEVTKKKPMLAYDALAHKMSILGGQYKVETEDLVDGMSPGIVN